MVLSFLAVAAMAQTFSIYDATMLEPVTGAWYEGGMGSPTVVYRKQLDDYVMFFESRVAAPDATCRQGYWGVGVAISTDGRNWTVDSQPILPPQAGTFRSCVVAHPYAVIDDDGADIHLWFKAEQPRKACQGLPSPHPWGCNQYTGVGYVRIAPDLQTVLAEPSLPVVDVDQTFGYPAITRVDDTWYMMLARRPDMYIATSNQPDGGWILDPTPVMQPGVTTWAEDELFNPALVCDEKSSAFPFRVYFGGRNLQNNVIVDGGWGDAISSDAQSWLVNLNEYFSFMPDPTLAWRHWDAVKVGPDTLIYFSEKDANGRNRLGFAGTTDAWSDWRVESRLCPQPVGWYDVRGDDELVDALVDLRDLFEVAVNEPGLDPAVADKLGKALEFIEDSFEEMFKGHPHHLADNSKKMIEELQKLQDDTGYDTSFLQQSTASVTLHAFRLQLERSEAVAGPADNDVVSAQAQLDLAEAAYDDGDWLAVALASKQGAEDARQPTYRGDFCPSSPVHEHLQALCALQGVHADLSALLALDPSDNKLDDALGKLEEALEAQADVDTKNVVKFLIDAVDKLQEATSDTELAQEALAVQGGDLVRAMLDEVELWGNANPDDVLDAEAELALGDQALAAFDWLLALQHFEDAAKAVSP